MNKSLHSGRLVRDPEMKYTSGQSQTAIANFTLAVERKYKKEGEPTADFLNFVAFGKTAEVVEKHCRKGTKLLITSHVQTGNYTNKDGVKVYTTNFVVDELEFCESKSSQASNNNQAPAQNETPDFLSIPDEIDDELPFH